MRVTDANKRFIVCTANRGASCLTAALKVLDGLSADDDAMDERMKPTQREIVYGLTEACRTSVATLSAWPGVVGKRQLSDAQSINFVVRETAN